MMSLMAGLLASKEDLDNLRKAFEAIDIDSDGTLTKEEIMKSAEQFGSC